MTELTLYNYFRSSTSYRVRIALNLKKIPYRNQHVHLLNNGGEQRQESYLKLNPLGTVPCLSIGEKTLGESMAILEYLNEAYPEPPLYPQDLWARAKVRQLCEMINSGVHPLQNLNVTQFLKEKMGASPEQVSAWTKHFIEKGLSAVERVLEQTAGTYSFGDKLTLADLFITPQYVSSLRFGADLAAFPLFTEIAANCLKLEAFASAHPDQHPDRS